VHYALEQGANHFDNADVYGNGRAERMLARILGPKSKDVIIASKVGHHPGTAEHAYEAQHIRHQCEQSLVNLKRDVIDIYYFHHGNFGPNDKYLEAGLAEMQKLKAEGKIRAIGLSAYSNKDFGRLALIIKPDVMQSWSSILDDGFIKKGSPVQKMLLELKATFVAFSPLAQGLLLDKYSSKNPPTFEAGDNRKDKENFGQKKLEALEPKIQKLKALVGNTTEDLSRAALQFLLSHKEVACPIPGFRNLKQVKINLAAADKPLSETELKEIYNIFMGEAVPA
jgi:myo-inositol catabolism protein IolS